MQEVINNKYNSHLFLNVENIYSEKKRLTSRQALDIYTLTIYVISISLYDSPFMITIQFLSNIFIFLRCYTCINIQVLKYTSCVIISYFVVSIFNLVVQKKKNVNTLQNNLKVLRKFKKFSSYVANLTWVGLR